MAEREPPVKYGKVTSFDADLRDSDRVVEHLMGLSEKYSRELRLLNATVINARRLQAKLRKAKTRRAVTWRRGVILTRNATILSIGVHWDLQERMHKAFLRRRRISKTWTLGTIGELIASLEDDIRCATNAIEHGLPDLAARIASGSHRQERPKHSRTKLSPTDRRVAIFEALVEPMTLRQMASKLPFAVPAIRKGVEELAREGVVTCIKQTFTTGLGGVPPNVYQRVTAQIEARA